MSTTLFAFDISASLQVDEAMISACARHRKSEHAGVIPLPAAHARITDYLGHFIEPGLK